MPLDPEFLQEIASKVDMPVAAKRPEPKGNYLAPMWSPILLDQRDVEEDSKENMPEQP